jgi:hypothetical protein
VKIVVRTNVDIETGGIGKFIRPILDRANALNLTV